MHGVRQRNWNHLLNDYMQFVLLILILAECSVWFTPGEIYGHLNRYHVVEHKCLRACE